jgi:hypothetical protein
MLFVALFTFADATAHWVATVCFDLIQIRQMLIYNIDLSLSTRVAIGEAKLYKPELAEQWTSMLTVCTHSYPC